MKELLQNMHNDQNMALAGERWHEGSDIQQAFGLRFDATCGPDLEGMSVRVTHGIRHVLQGMTNFTQNVDKMIGETDSNCMLKTLQT